MIQQGSGCRQQGGGNLHESLRILSGLVLIRGPVCCRWPKLSRQLSLGRRPRQVVESSGKVSTRSAPWPARLSSPAAPPKRQSKEAAHRWLPGSGANQAGDEEVGSAAELWDQQKGTKSVFHSTSMNIGILRFHPTYWTMYTRIVHAKLLHEHTCTNVQIKKSYSADLNQHFVLVRSSRSAR